jgi:Protein of unknown function (DUF559)
MTSYRPTNRPLFRPAIPAGACAYIGSKTIFPGRRTIFEPRFIRPATSSLPSRCAHRALGNLESIDAYRRDRRKDQLLQEHGYFVLRFLAEDVGKHLDMVLDTIQRTLFSRARR